MRLSQLNAEQGPALLAICLPTAHRDDDRKPVASCPQDEGVRLSQLNADQAAALLAAQPRRGGKKSDWHRALLRQVQHLTCLSALQT